MILTLGQGPSPGRGPGSLHFLHRVGRPPSFSCQWHRNHNCTEAKESEQSSKWNASYWGHFFDPVHILSHTVSYLTSQPDSVVRSLTDIKIVDPISTPLLLPWPTSLSCPFSHHCVICKGLRRWRVFFSNLHARVLKQLKRQLSGAGIDSRKTQTWKKKKHFIIQAVCCNKHKKLHIFNLIFSPVWFSFLVHLMWINPCVAPKMPLINHNKHQNDILVDFFFHSWLTACFGKQTKAKLHLLHGDFISNGWLKKKNMVDAFIKYGNLPNGLWQSHWRSLFRCRWLCQCWLPLSPLQLPVWHEKKASYGLTVTGLQINDTDCIK